MSLIVADDTVPKEGILLSYWEEGRWVTVQIDPDKDLVGLTEIADMFQVSRQRVAQLSKRGDFPPPVGITKAGTFWLRQRVVTYDANRQPRVDRYLGLPKRQTETKRTAARGAKSGDTARSKQKVR